MYQLGLDFAIDIIAMRREDAPIDLDDESPQYIRGFLDALTSIHGHLLESDPLQLCEDCDCVADYYMVHDEIWITATNASQADLLCIACLEDRVGRRLTRQDFPDVPVNHLTSASTNRMRARITGA